VIARILSGFAVAVVLGVFGHLGIEGARGDR
jgi:hypothetical protein